MAIPTCSGCSRLSGAPTTSCCGRSCGSRTTTTRVARAAMYDWFNRHLRLGFEETPKERPFIPLTVAEASVWDADHPRPRGGEVHERTLLKWMADQAASSMRALEPHDAESAGRFQGVVGAGFSVLLGGAVGTR